jgi:hypothetical protein
MKDGLGNPITVGDEIIYVSNWGASRVHFYKRTVTALGANRVYTKDSKAYGWTEPQRVLVIRHLSWDD